MDFYLAAYNLNILTHFHNQTGKDNLKWFKIAGKYKFP